MTPKMYATPCDRQRGNGTGSDRGARRGGWRRLGRAGALAACAGLAASPAAAGPEGGTVAAGAASITRTGPLTTVHQRSQSAVINWRSFDIGAGEAVHFQQPGATSRALNRVTGARPTPTQIDGALRANGIVYIVNPAGVIFSPTASINVGGILAAGGAMSDRDFMAGRNRFTALGAQVRNHGSIQAESIAALVGGSVVNTGAIHVPQGTVVMAAGDTVTLGSPLGGVMVSLDRARTSAGASSRAGADGAAPAVQAGGEVRARNVSLVASDMYSLAINGRIDVSGRTGGSVTATAGQVTLGGTIDASGVDAGGTVLLGGDVQGGGETPTAERTLVKRGASVDASASAGAGGKVVIWADGQTLYQGSIDVSGATRGGFVEVSGLESLMYDGAVDVTGPDGAGGTILLDPTDIIIVESGGAAATREDLDDFDDPDLGPGQTTVSVDTLRQLAQGGELVLKASRDIIVRADLSDFSLEALVLLAGRSIIAEAPGVGLPVPFIAPGAVVLAMANVGPGDLTDGSAPDPAVRGEGPGGIDAGPIFGSGSRSLGLFELGGFPLGDNESIAMDLRLGAGFTDDHVGELRATELGSPGGDILLSARGRRDLGGPRGDISITDFVDGEGGTALLVRDADAVTLNEVFFRLDVADVRSLRVADQRESAGGSAEESIDITSSLGLFEGTLDAPQISITNFEGDIGGDYRSSGGSIDIVAAGTVIGQYDADAGAAGSRIDVEGASVDGAFAADVLDIEAFRTGSEATFLGGSSILVNAESIDGDFTAPVITAIAGDGGKTPGEIFGNFTAPAAPGAPGRIELRGEEVRATALAERGDIILDSTNFLDGDYDAGSSIDARSPFINGTYTAPDISVVAPLDGEGGSISGQFTSPGATGRIALDGNRMGGTVDGGGDLVFTARSLGDGAISMGSSDPLSDFNSLTIRLDNPQSFSSGSFVSISLPEGGMSGMSLDPTGAFSIGGLGDMSAAGGLDVTLELLPMIDGSFPVFDRVAVSSSVLGMAPDRTLRLVGAGGLEFIVADGPMGASPGEASGGFGVVSHALMDPSGAMIRPGMIRLGDVYTTGDQTYFAEGGTISAATGEGGAGFLTGGGAFEAMAAAFSLDGSADTVINTAGPGGPGAITIGAGVFSDVGAGLIADASSAEGATRADIRIDGPIDLSRGESGGLIGTTDLRLRAQSISVAGDISVAGSAIFDLPVFESTSQGVAVLDLTAPGGGGGVIAAGGDIIIRGGAAVRDGDAAIIRSNDGVQLLAPSGNVIAENFAGVLVEVGDLVIDTLGGELGGDVSLSNVFVDTGGLRILSDGSVTFTQDGEPLFVIVRGTLGAEVDPDSRAIWVEAAELLQIAQLADAGAAARVLFLAGHEFLPAAEAPGGAISLEGAIISLVMNSDSELIVRSTGGNIAMFADAVEVITKRDDPLQVIIAADGGEATDPADPGRTVTFESRGDAPLEVKGLTAVQLVPTLHRMFNSDLGDPERFDLDRIEEIFAEIDAMTAEIDALDAELGALDPLSAEAGQIRDLLADKRMERSNRLLDVAGAETAEGLLSMFDQAFLEQLDAAWEILRLSGGGESVNEPEHAAIEARRDAVGRTLDQLIGMFGSADVKARRIEDLIEEFSALIALRQDQIADLLERLISTRDRIRQLVDTMVAIDDPLAGPRLDAMRATLTMCDQLIAKIAGFESDFAGFDMSLGGIEGRFDSLEGVFDETTFDELCELLDELIALEPMLKDPMIVAMMQEVAIADGAKRIDVDRGVAVNLNPATQDAEAVHASPDATPRPVRQELILSEADLEILERMAIHARDLRQAERTGATSGRGLFNDVPGDRIRSVTALDYEIAKTRFDVRGVRSALTQYREIFLAAREDPDAAEERQQQIRDQLQAQMLAYIEQSDALEPDAVEHRQFIRQHAPALDEDLRKLRALLAHLDQIGMTQREAEFSRRAVLELVRPTSEMTAGYLEALITAAPAPAPAAPEAEPAAPEPAASEVEVSAR